MPVLKLNSSRDPCVPRGVTIDIAAEIDSYLEELRPTIEQHRDEADRLGRLPDQLVAQLREAGAFRLYLPRELGGAELSLRATLELLEGLGRIDGATAWTVWNLNMGLVAAMLPPSGVAKLGPRPADGQLDPAGHRDTRRRRIPAVGGMEDRQRRARRRVVPGSTAS